MFRHGATYAGHPTCCAAALANLDILEREDLVARGRELEGELLDALRPLADHDAVKEVRGGTGLAAAVDLHPDVIAACPAPSAASAAVQEAGVLLRSQATGVAIGPPLMVEREHLDEIATAVARRARRRRGRLARSPSIVRARPLLTPEPAMDAVPPTMPRRKQLALIAHDNRKADMLEWARYNRGTLARHELHATGTTGAKLASELGLDVHRFLSGPLGGDQQVGAAIAEGRIDFVIFFWDPLEPHPHDVDVKALLRIAVVYNVPIACNRATADFVLSSPLMGEEYHRAATA